MRVGPYTYEIKRNGKQSSYSVTDGKDTISFPIVYAFGQGKMGQTYMLERDGKFYESLVSFYSEPKGLDFTIGAPRGVPASLNDAVGRLLTANEVASCFSCHATGAVVNGSQLRLDKLRTEYVAKLVMDQAVDTSLLSKRAIHLQSQFTIPVCLAAMN
jgi:hypothetical protein